MLEKEICKTCEYFEQIQGLFGKCTNLDLVYEDKVVDRLLEEDHVFASDPACPSYKPLQQSFNPRIAPHRNSIAQPAFFPLFFDFFPDLSLAPEMPSIAQRFVEDKKREEEWINPIFRRAYPVQKVVKIGKGADGRMRRMA